MNAAAIRRVPERLLGHPFAEFVPEEVGARCHFVRVPAMRNPLRSALRWDALPD